MTLNQFRILYVLSQEEVCTQRELARKLQLAVSSVYENLKILREQNLVKDFSLTEQGGRQLELYRVENAVILAAGMATRFAPVSYEKPKGLLRVKGEILIERQIRQLQEAGIEKITIVVGYMKEQFFYLEEKYGVELAVYEAYYKTNNLMTLYAAKGKLGNTYICCSDIYYTRNPFHSHEFRPHYACVYQAGAGAEYCVAFSKNRKINKTAVVGRDTWIMQGHAYFSHAFSQQLVWLMESVCSSPRAASMYWEDLYMEHMEKLPLYAQCYEDETVLEFDSIDDLMGFDNAFLDNTDSRVIQNIVTALACERNEIKEFYPIKKGMTNLSFRFTCRGKKYVYRHPGVGTEKIINRRSEFFSENAAYQLGLDALLVAMDENAGWKLSRYLENARDFEERNPGDVRKAMQCLKRLHDAKIQSPWDFDSESETKKLIRLTRQNGKIAFDDFAELEQAMERAYFRVAADGKEKCLCHNDSFSPNFLTDGNEMYLIDWEYSGNNDPANDLGVFICSADFNEREVKEIFQIYMGRPLSGEEERHFTAYVAIAAYYCFAWALYKESIGNHIGEYLYKWYKYAKTYSKITLKQYEDYDAGH